MSYTCPRCGRTSHHPEDEKNRYCAACKEFEVDEKANNILATGAITAALTMTRASAIKDVSLVTVDGQATNQLVVKFDFLKSPYRLTIERVDE